MKYYSSQPQLSSNNYLEDVEMSLLHLNIC